MHGFRVSTLALAVALAGGCFVSRAHRNEPVSPQALAGLEPGRSTAADVVALLGAPAEVVELDRRSAYRYEYTHSKRAGFSIIVFTMINEDTHSDRAWVFFDEDGVLTHVGTTLAADRARWAMPFQDLDDDEDEDE